VLNFKLVVNEVTIGMKVVEISDHAPEALTSVHTLNCTQRHSSHTNSVLDVINKTGSNLDNKKRKYLALTSDRTGPDRTGLLQTLCQCLTARMASCLPVCCLSVCLSIAVHQLYEAVFPQKLLLILRYYRNYLS
jgi:hypothetical protein